MAANFCSVFGCSVSSSLPGDHGMICVTTSIVALVNVCTEDFLYHDFKKC